MCIDDVGDALERELFSGDTEEFGGYKTNSGKHSSTTVLELGLTEPWEPFWGTLGETGRVEIDGCSGAAIGSKAVFLSILV